MEQQTSTAGRTLVLGASLAFVSLGCDLDRTGNLQLAGTAGGALLVGGAGGATALPHQGGQDSEPLPVRGDAGAAGTAGAWSTASGGIGSGGIGSAFSGGAGGQGQGGAGGAVFIQLESVICGDGVVDPLTEECDDGGDLEAADLCSPTCQVEDALVALTPESAWDPRQRDEQLSRFHGAGRHPLAAGENGFALAYIQEPHAVDAEPFVGLTIYESPGPIPLDQPIPDHDPWSVVNASAGTIAPLFADPVVAALSDGHFVVAFTDYDGSLIGGESGGDGDALGIAIRKFAPGVADPVTSTHANAAIDFNQYDPDLLTLSDGRLLVAWADDRDYFTGPDLYFRILTQDLHGPATDSALAITDAAEGHVALTQFGTEWAAAWRASAPHPEDPNSTGGETIEVQLANGDHWTVQDLLPDDEEWGPFLPGGPDDHPALVPIGPNHLLVLFTVGTDPNQTGVADVSRLRVALVDTQATDPNVFAQFVPHAVDADPFVSQSHPAATLVGEPGPEQRLFISWRTESQGDSFGDDLHLMEAWIRPATAGDTHTFTIDEALYTLDYNAPRPLPRWDAGLPGDQRSPALAAAPTYPYGSLVATWTDFGQEHDLLQSQPDVLVQMSALPLKPRIQYSDGDWELCESDADCPLDTVCTAQVAPYGLGRYLRVCALPHCANHTQDEDEAGVDCGGEACGTCICDDPEASWVMGSLCDNPTVGQCETATLVTSPVSPSSSHAAPTVTLGATSICANAMPEYKFFHEPPGGSWNVLCDWQSSASCDWETVTEAVGTHRLQVWVRAQGSTALYEGHSPPIEFFIEPYPPLDPCGAATLTTSPLSPSSGPTITLTTTSTCGSSTPEFRFFHEPPEGSWEVLCDWQVNGSCDWETAGETTGTHLLQVWVRAQGSGAQYESFSPVVSYTLESP